jgi:ornithine cyclodeaminase/alanine dehydrogenase-like protein (mu-crystallin family)
MSLLVVSARDVATVTSTLSHDELMALIASVFISLSSTQGVCSPHRTSIQTSHHNVLFMPSRVDAIGTSIKVVSVPTSISAASTGLPASTLVMDEVTGGVRAIVNARGLTAIRTAAGEVDKIHILRLLNSVGF